MNMNLEKTKKMSRSLRIVMQTFYWASVICVIALSIAFVVVSLLPDNNFIVPADSRDNIAFSIDGLVSYGIGLSTAAELSLKPIYQSICFMAAIISVGLSFIFKQISRILKTVEANRPFSEENSRSLTVIGFILLMGSFVIRIAEGIVARAIINTLNIQNMKVNYGIDVFMIVLGFLMLILAGVFKYGSYLQQEYDTTL